MLLIWSSYCQSSTQKRQKERKPERDVSTMFSLRSAPLISPNQLWKTAPFSPSSHVICRYCQSKSVSLTVQHITQTFKRLTLTASDCQLRGHFSLSVYQSISVRLPFHFAFVQVQIIHVESSPSHTNSRSERRILGQTDRKVVNIPEGGILHSTGSFAKFTRSPTHPSYQQGN